MVDRDSDCRFWSRVAGRDLVHLGKDIWSKKDFAALLAYFGGNILEDENLAAPAMDMLNPFWRYLAFAEVTHRHFNSLSSPANQSIRWGWGGTP